MCCGFTNQTQMNNKQSGLKTECIDGETFSHGPFERKTVLLNVFLERYLIYILPVLLFVRMYSRLKGSKARKTKPFWYTCNSTPLVL